jgi:hypothetical protein
LEYLVEKGKRIEERCRESGRLGIISNGERMGGREELDRLLEVQKWI